MTGLITKLLILLLLASPSWAFVEQLRPNQQNGDGIPCNALYSSLFFYILPNGPSAAVLGSIMQREWVSGGWTAQDITDNTNLLNLVDSQPTLWQKMLVAIAAQISCFNWELDVDEFNTPAKFRTRLGLPAAP